MPIPQEAGVATAADKQRLVPAFGIGTDGYRPALARCAAKGNVESAASLHFAVDSSGSLLPRLQIGAGPVAAKGVCCRLLWAMPSGPDAKRAHMNMSIHFRIYGRLFQFNVGRWFVQIELPFIGNWVLG